MKIKALIEDACMRSWRDRLIVSRDALATARKDFSLPREADVIAVIFQFESHDYTERPTVPLADPVPGATIGSPVYSYNFYYADDYGYMAFVRSTSNTAWIIKSFKLNDEPNPRDSSPFAQFRKNK